MRFTLLTVFLLVLSGCVAFQGIGLVPERQDTQQSSEDDTIESLDPQEDVLEEEVPEYIDTVVVDSGIATGISVRQNNLVSNPSISSNPQTITSSSIEQSQSEFVPTVSVEESPVLLPEISQDADAEVEQAQYVSELLGSATSVVGDGGDSGISDLSVIELGDAPSSTSEDIDEQVFVGGFDQLETSETQGPVERSPTSDGVAAGDLGMLFMLPLAMSGLIGFVAYGRAQKIFGPKFMETYSQALDEETIRQMALGKNAKHTKTLLGHIEDFYSGVWRSMRGHLLVLLTALMFGIVVPLLYVTGLVAYDAQSSLASSMMFSTDQAVRGVSDAMEVLGGQVFSQNEVRLDGLSLPTKWSLIGLRWLCDTILIFSVLWLVLVSLYSYGIYKGIFIPKHIVDRYRKLTGNESWLRAVRWRFFPSVRKDHLEELRSNLPQ